MTQEYPSERNAAVEQRLREAFEAALEEYEQATLEEKPQALTRYRDALNRFADFVLRKELPKIE